MSKNNSIKDRPTYEHLIDAVQKEWDDYPNINEIVNNRTEKIHKSISFDDDNYFKVSVGAIVSLIVDKEILTKDIDGCERAKNNTEDLLLAKTDQCDEYYQQLMKPDVSIVNDMLDCVNADVGPDKIIVIGDYKYAFVTDRNGNGEKVIKLWVYQQDESCKTGDWVEVSDLTGVYVWEYQEIKSYAVGVGMIEEDQDLFI